MQIPCKRRNRISDPIMYEMIRKIFSPDDTNPPEACAMFMPDDETDDEEYAMAA